MKRRPIVGSALLATATVALGCLPRPIPPATCPQAASCPTPVALSDAQRRAFLHYYSPLVLKQASEALAPGRDWIASFDFDRDGDLSNNHLHWMVSLDDFVQQASPPPAWDIRPTLYAHAVEFTDCGRKTLVLLYHVYHPMQLGSIHDWERIEIRLDDVKGTPGTGETFRFAVVTEHSWHRAAGAGALEFFDNSPHGKHLLVWQAPWDLGFVDPPAAVPMTAELRFVKTPWSTLAALLGGNALARVELAGIAGTAPYHYVFADGAVAGTSGSIGAAPIDPNDPAPQTSGKAAFQLVPGAQVRRVEYELQDTGDLLATHALSPSSGGICGLFTCDDCDYACAGGRAWTCEVERIEVDEPMLDEIGQVAIAAGMQELPATACDRVLPSAKRRGYPRKHWWWGVYLFDREGSFRSNAFAFGVPDGPRFGLRHVANGCNGCLGAYWKQHDYFLHDGVATSGGGGANERGEWLPAGWHRAQCGGFDGRWHQIFPD